MLLGSQALTNDPYYNDVVLLLSARDGVIKDYSKTPKTISVFGNTTISSSQAKWGNKSIYFDGNGDYLSIASSNDFAFGTSDFTIELFVYPTASTTTSWNPILAIGSITAGREIRIGQNIAGGGVGIVFPNNSNNSNIYNYAGYLTLHSWNHLALVKKGSLLTFYKNGVSLLSYTNITFDFSINCPVLIGFGFYGVSDGYFTGGNMECIRITRRARDIVVPTQPFPNW